MPGDFREMLARLVAARRVTAGRLTAAGEVELRAVLGGATPSDALVRALAPVLGWHTADLFLAVGLRVPDDLAPAGRPLDMVPSIAWYAVYLPDAGRRVNDLIRAVVAEERVVPAAEQRYDKWFEPGFGALLMRLFGNRNMSALDAVQVLYCLAGFGPWSPSTLRMVGAGRKEPTPDLVAAAAVALGIPAGDLAALAGMDPPAPPADECPGADEVAALIWAMRNASAARLELVGRRAHEIRHEYDDVTSPGLVCHCPMFRGPRR